MEGIMRLPSSDLDRIRRELDPSFSYIILERQGSQGNMEVLVDLLWRLGMPILETKVHENTAAARLFLVAKLDPEKANEVSKEYVSVNLPENVICVFYSSLVRDAGRG
jgi:hypothetical protein